MGCRNRHFRNIVIANIGLAFSSISYTFIHLHPFYPLSSIVIHFHLFSLFSIHLFSDLKCWSIIFTGLGIFITKEHSKNFCNLWSTCWISLGEDDHHNDADTSKHNVFTESAKASSSLGAKRFWKIVEFNTHVNQSLKPWGVSIDPLDHC